MNPTQNQNFKKSLNRRITELNTSLCVGCDPHADRLPAFAARTLRDGGPSAFLREFSTALIDAAAGVAPAVKLQSAFYEAFGSEGFQVLGEMCAYARTNNLLTILDAKRGDIASTMTAYGQMAFDKMQADALTVTPYMGIDTIQPLIPWLHQGHGIYIVWVSSNAAGALLQDAQTASGEPLSTVLYREFRRYMEEHGLGEAFGLVLGATRVTDLSPQILSTLEHEALLMPGVGAQGGQITPSVRRLLAAGHSLLPQSRSLSDFGADAGSWSDHRDQVKQRVKRAARDLALR